LELTYSDNAYPHEITARQAAAMICEALHIVLVASDQERVAIAIFNTLDQLYAGAFSVALALPIYAPKITRPHVRLLPASATYRPLTGQKAFPQLMLGFLLDTPENRRVLDFVTRCAGARCMPSVEEFAARGPIVILDGCNREIAEGAALVVENLRRLHHGQADDFTLN
jgi:hypothetical protein